MKKIMFYTVLMLQVCISVYADDFDQHQLDEIVSATQQAEGLGHLSVHTILFARGIQSYQLTENGWVAAGPLAKLFLTENGTIGDEKIGTHYAHLPTPAWEVLNGRVLAESATAILAQTVNGVEIGATSENVAWLNVKLQENDFGLQRILRVNTRSGVAPNDTFNYKVGSFVGVGYTTYYVFLK